MNSQKTLCLFLFVCLTSTCSCQAALRKLVTLPEKRAAAASTSTAPTVGQSVIDKDYLEYQYQVRSHFLEKDYAWIDEEAHKARTNKIRLPGGFWKLRVLYGVFEEPVKGEGTDANWEAMIAQLTAWTKERPESITARVALAGAWKDYGWKARGNGRANSVTQDGWATFNERLGTASNILAEAASLKERCPHWYVNALWVGTSQSWDRDAFERVFQAGVNLEPTYYYIHNAKAAYLMPRWHGEAGEWERFAEESASGPEGEVIYFAIYDVMMDLNGMSLMNDHQQAVPRLIAAFRTIEKLYGPSNTRTNEAALFASFGNDAATTVELFNRIGNQWDPNVWRSPKIFEAFRQQAQERLRAEAAAAKNPRR